MMVAHELKEGVLIAWDAIRANKMRAALTTLGIVIGIVTVTLMGTALQGLRRGFVQSISVLGTDVLYVQRFDWFINTHEEWVKQQRRREIPLQYAREIARQMTLAQAVAPFVEGRETVRYKTQYASGVSIIGSTDQFLLTGGLSVAEGRFLSVPESSGARPVCVLGSQAWTNLFKGGNALGEKVYVGGHPFEVVGVLERQGDFLGAFSLDNQVVIPIGTFTANFDPFPDCTIQIKTVSVGVMDDAREEVRGIMRRVRHLSANQEDDFAINQQDQFLETFNRVAKVIASVGLFITSLSLFVGGIGIMNIMFVSVAERTKEIGIRKAIGAKRRAILLQFLTEAASICLLGGLIGLAIAWPLTLLLGKFMPASMSPLIVAAALGVSLVTGVVAGFIPAWRAARLNPVDALRAE